ncbi:hypothetical protein [Chryseobacterium sp. JK1]|uniref:hypothetical protein n=1 Tax=Chryseobacterium sp. JK1 TaxID=874294 RepID=UPI003D698853
MKFIISILFFVLLFNCSKTKEKEDRLLIPENDFSVSDFDKKIDSLKQAYKNDSLKIIMPHEFDKRFNKNYLSGSIHFLIIDKNKSFYVIKSLKSNFSMCLNTAPFSKQDSIYLIEQENGLIDKAEPIKTTDIINLLKKNRNSIVNTENNNPLMISFALKDNTLKGSSMYGIISFMERNGMNSYTIRRMNEYELRKVSQQ